MELWGENSSVTAGALPTECAVAEYMTRGAGAEVALSSTSAITMSPRVRPLTAASAWASPRALA